MTKIVLSLLALPSVGMAQSSGTLRGMVTLDEKGTPAHSASVLIVHLGRKAETDDEGVYEFQQVAPGTYDVVVHLHALTDERRTVQVKAGETATLDFQLRLSPLRQEMTVTASGRDQTTFESFQAVNTVESLELAEKSETSIGEVLDNEPGVAKRSFGPGSARPVIRGFDGDRVLVLQDGIPSGALSSQSGDHGEPIDSLALERLEVVKGPATLLYGSNAIGGVVNAITRHHQFREHPHAGLRGYVTGIGGSTNAHGGGSGGFEYGFKKWMLWGSGGGQRTGDYATPIGEIKNSKTRVTDTSGGFGWSGEKKSFSLGYGYDDGRYGVPFAAQFEGGGGNGQAEEEELIDLKFRRHNLRFNGGFQNISSVFEAFRLSLNYSDWQHKELEGDQVGTVFDNKQFTFRGVFDQKKSARFSGSFGFWGLHRDYETVGVEALSPPVGQNAVALFGLEEVNFERFRLQFGGRLEHNRYDPIGLLERSFTGFSGAAGIHIPLWKGGAFVTNYTHSFRAPSLEELYNNGPHVGNLTFEIGNPYLKRERSNGIDFALRHSGSRLRAEANFYYYGLSDFVFLAPTGEVKDGLTEADYFQADSRFLGTELGLEVGVHRNFWINLGFDAVDAEVKQTGTPLPRIPPVRGRFGFDARYKGLSLRPEVLMARDQDQVFSTETRTPGYTVFNLRASYTVPRQHFVHVVSVNAFNLGDRLYRNHLSFIKELAPEIGRGIRLTYTVRFF